MLGLYAKGSADPRRFTLTYRGYDLEVTRTASDWRVGIHPRTADLPILGVGEVYAANQHQAVIEGKAKVDGVLSLLAYC